MSNDLLRLPATYAAINFKGEDLDPHLVSSIMGVRPTLSYRKGDEYLIEGSSRVRKFGLWVYSTRNIIESASLKRHLEPLEELIIGSKTAWPVRRAKIKALVRGGKVRLRVDIFWYGKAGVDYPKIGLSFEAIVAMAGGTIESDFHRDGDAVEAA